MPPYISYLRHLLIWSFIVVASLVPSAVSAQTPFPDCATRTGVNASLILPASLEITIDGEQKEPPFLLAVFTPEGHCAGQVRWSGDPTTLTAWGSTEVLETSADTVLVPGDTMQIRLYDPATDTGYTPDNSRITVTLRPDKAHLNPHLRYVPDGMYLLNRIRVVQSALITRQEE